jgi:hypothetical protein
MRLRPSCKSAHTKLSLRKIFQQAISTARSSIGMRRPISCSCSLATCSITSDRLSITWRGASPEHMRTNGLNSPIFLDKKEFNAVNSNGIPKRGSGLEKMHDMPASAQTAIESLQPYQRVHGLPEESEPLWLLHQLSNEDKHRTLNLVAAGVDARLDVSTSPIHPAYGLTGRTGYLPREDGKEIYRIPLPANPSQVQDYSRFTFDVALDLKGPGRGISLQEGLRDMREAVAGTIRLLEKHTLPSLLTIPIQTKEIP